MKTAALVPINALPLAKSRLESVLTPAERRDLVFWMAGRMLDAIHDAGVIDALAIVTPDETIAAWAKDRGVVAIPQMSGGLNDGLEVGRAWAREQAAEVLLVLLGDLPLLTADELAHFVALASDPDASSTVIALAPDRQERGTNGLLQRPIDTLPFAFGAGSLVRHWRLAFERRIEPEVFRSPGTSFDVDIPGDARDLALSGLWSPPDGAMSIVREEKPA